LGVLDLRLVQGAIEGINDIMQGTNNASDIYICIYIDLYALTFLYSSITWSAYL